MCFNTPQSRTLACSHARHQRHGYSPCSSWSGKMFPNREKHITRYEPHFVDSMRLQVTKELATFFVTRGKFCGGFFQATHKEQFVENVCSFHSDFQSAAQSPWVIISPNATNWLTSLLGTKAVFAEALKAPRQKDSCSNFKSTQDPSMFVLSMAIFRMVSRPLPKCIAPAFCLFVRAFYPTNEIMKWYWIVFVDIRH